MGISGSLKCFTCILFETGLAKSSMTCGELQFLL